MRPTGRPASTNCPAPIDSVLTRAGKRRAHFRSREAQPRLFQCDPGALDPRPRRGDLRFPKRQRTGLLGRRRARAAPEPLVLAAGDACFLLRPEQLDLLLGNLRLRPGDAVAMVRVVEAEQHIAATDASAADEGRRHPGHPAADLGGDVDFLARAHRAETAHRNRTDSGLYGCGERNGNAHIGPSERQLRPLRDQESRRADRTAEDGGRQQVTDSATHLRCSRNSGRPPLALSEIRGSSSTLCPGSGRTFQRWPRHATISRIAISAKRSPMHMRAPPP